MTDNFVSQLRLFYPARIQSRTGAAANPATPVPAQALLWPTWKAEDRMLAATDY